MLKNSLFFVIGLILGLLSSNTFYEHLETISSNDDNGSETMNQSAPPKNAISSQSAAFDDGTIDISQQQAIDAHKELLANMQSEIAKLQQKNRSLEQALEDSEQATEVAYDTQEETPAIMTQEEAQEHLSQQLQQHVPMPFLKLIHDLDPVAQMEVIRMHEAEDDLDWGYDLETTIQDFFLTHYDQSKVLLTAVTCKKMRCEILLTLPSNTYFQDIFASLREQPWWHFSNTNSRTANGDNDDELVMYLFASEWRAPQ